MAAGKNTIVVYKDWITIFNQLEPAEAGKLIQHFFRYVNDLHPDPPDRLTQLLFAPIENTLKRDLKSWEATKEVKSDNGVMGNLKRWHKDLYDKVLNKEIDMEKAQDIANNRKQSPSDKKTRNPSKSVANIAVSVTDSVSATEKKINTPPPIEEFLSHCKGLLKDKYLPLEFSLKAKYKTWVDDGWKDGNKKPIKNWKLKIENTIPYLKPMQITNDQLTGPKW